MFECRQVKAYIPGMIHKEASHNKARSDEEGNDHPQHYVWLNSRRHTLLQDNP